jgi:hypothetical protein
MDENVGQAPADTLEHGLQRWLRIAERHAEETEGYRLYPGDWAALADKLRRAITALGA